MESLWNVSGDLGAEQDPTLIDPKNYATNTKVAERAKNDICALLPSIRTQRATIEERWNRLDKVWQGKFGVRLYSGQSDVYVPMARKVIETHVSHAATQIFPTNQLFFIEGVGPEQQMAIQLKMQIAALIEHDLEQAKVKQWMPLFLRQGFTKGCSVVKNHWKINRSTNYRKKAVEGFLGERTFTVEPTTVKLYEGPTFDVVDLYRWYIHPITSKSIDDARIIFEDLDVDWSHLKGMERAGVYSNVDKIKDLAERGQTIETSNRNQRVEVDGYTVENQIKEDRYRLTEIWAKFDLYGTGETIPCKIVAVGDTILEVRQNPFFNQRAPYRAWRCTDRIDNFYGQGILENIESLQYVFNAMINQGVDNANWQMNPLIVVNKAQLASNPADLSIAPRAFVYTWADPSQSIHFERPPETYNISFNVANLISGMLQDVGGAPPIMQGKMGSRGTTATEASILQQGAGAFTNVVASKIEAEVLSPMLKDWYMLEQQFRSEETYVKVTGAPPIPVVPQDLVGDYMFNWHVSTEAQQRMMMLQQGIQPGQGTTAVPTMGQGGPGAGGEGGLPPEIAALMGGG